MSPTEAFQRARDALLEDPASFAWPKLEDFNWAWDWFEPLAKGNDAAALIVVSDATSTVTKRTFAELSERSTRLGRWLTEQGVARGDRVLVMLPNVVPLWETMLAAIKIGAVVIPATTQLTPDDIDDRIARGEVRHMVTDAANATKLRSPERLKVRLAVGGAPDFTAFDDAFSANELARVATKATDPLLLYFTSGTTAKPKLVMHTHQSYPVGHLSTMYWLGLRPGDVHQNISSPGWAKHAWSSFFAPWNAGATILVHDAPRFSAKRAVDVLREHDVNTLCAPPTVWRMMILDDLGARPAKLRELASAGEPLNPEVIESVQRAWNITIRDGYGQTETTAQIGNPPGLPVRLGSMGKPLPGYEVALLDAAGNESDEGEVSLRLGEARPAGLMVGYLDDPERTAAVTAGGYYRTGDEARRDEDGYIHFVSTGGRGGLPLRVQEQRLSHLTVRAREHPRRARARRGSGGRAEPGPGAPLGPEGIPRPHARHRADQGNGPRHLRAVQREACTLQANPPPRVHGAAQDHLGQDPPGRPPQKRRAKAGRQRAVAERVLARRDVSDYGRSSGIPSSVSKNDSSSVSSSASFVTGLPAPWPAFVSTRRRIGWSGSPCASCMRAAILRACIGSTRESLSAVVKSIDGYFVPFSTWWYGLYA
jgi:acetyl-CoA synthetase